MDYLSGSKTVVLYITAGWNCFVEAIDFERCCSDMKRCCVPIDSPFHRRLLHASWHIHEVNTKFGHRHFRRACHDRPQAGDRQDARKQTSGSHEWDISPLRSPTR